MAIVQLGMFIRTLIGDGVSTEITIDLKKQIEQGPILPETPQQIISVTSTVGPAIVNSFLSHGKVTVVFESPIPLGSGGNLAITLGF